MLIFRAQRMRASQASMTCLVADQGWFDLVAPCVRDRRGIHPTRDEQISPTMED